MNCMIYVDGEYVEKAYSVNEAEIRIASYVFHHPEAHDAIFCIVDEYGESHIRFM